jgi:hypothetical protein
MGVSDQIQATAALTPRGWVGPKAGLDIMKIKISCPCRELNHDSSIAQP